MVEIETQNHPDAVCFLHGISCRVLGEVLIERDALRAKLAELAEAQRVREAGLDPNEAPEGYVAALMGDGCCNGCAFYNTDCPGDCGGVSCQEDNRRDGCCVIFVPRCSTTQEVKP